MDKPLHHHFLPADLSRLQWSPCLDLEIKYDRPSGISRDLITPGKQSNLRGYHEAAFPIGADEVGYVLIPDSALRLVRSSHAD